MAWAKPEYTRDEVNRAAEILLKGGGQEQDLDYAFEVVNNWRFIHAYPLQSIKMTLRGRAIKQDKSSIVSQRSKRIKAILFKLKNNREARLEMKLSQMHDIGGCRAVLKNVECVELLVSAYERHTKQNPRRGGVFHRKYDYINKPKPSGYRGIHLVYKYCSASKKLEVYNGLKIEIQIRSRLQHAWATAVEAVDFYTKQALKSNIGDVQWKRFFALASNELARMENRPLVPGTPLDPVVSKGELKNYSKQLGLLEGLTTATRLAETREGSFKDGHFFLLQLDILARRMKIRSFQQHQAKEAQEKYLEVEKQNKDKPEMETVLVSVDSLADLPKAYPSYHLDIRGFAAALRKILDS